MPLVVVLGACGEPESPPWLAVDGPSALSLPRECKTAGMVCAANALSAVPGDGAASLLGLAVAVVLLPASIAPAPVVGRGICPFAHEPGATAPTARTAGAAPVQAAAASNGVEGTNELATALPPPLVLLLPLLVLAATPLAVWHAP